MFKEIEIRYELLNKNKLADFLQKNSDLQTKKHQIDTYYDSPEDSFFKNPKKILNWVRIRNENGKLTFTHKHWMPEDAEFQTYCEETECPMNSEKDFDNILQSLGFKFRFIPIMIVDKFRRSFMYKNCEISLDEVKNLGDFIEVEYKGKETDISKILNFLKEVLKEIPAELGKKQQNGYVSQIMIDRGLL